MYNTSLTRREFITQTTCGAFALSGLIGVSNADEAENPPKIRTITRGPKFHWFGYYDKLQFDPSGRYALAMEVDFEHRSPKADDVIKVGMVDLQENDRWIELGETTAWCWQQGCMLQWRPGSKEEILWNDRVKDHYVCHILNINTRKRRSLPHPIYCLSPDGKWALSTDFRRLADTRPGYGYNGIPDPNFDALAPDDAGIFRMDLETGRRELLISLADVVARPCAWGDLSPFKHWFNHLLINPDGSRFTFLHRWRNPREPWRKTRMLTAAPDGSDVRILIDSGYVSHFIWRDPEHIAAWSKMTVNGDAALFLCRDKPGGTVEQIGKKVITGDGHFTYSPDRQWILYDGGPGRARSQPVYLYNVAANRRRRLGSFHSPPEYTGEWRCDTHPRFSPDGRSVVIDSPHTGQGRQMHLIDISKITG